jgi:hypothetical protein
MRIDRLCGIGAATWPRRYGFILAMIIATLDGEHDDQYWRGRCNYFSNALF